MQGWICRRGAGRAGYWRAGDAARGGPEHRVEEARGAGLKANAALANVPMSESALAVHAGVAKWQTQRT